MFIERGTAGTGSRENVLRHLVDFIFGVLVTAVERATASGLVKQFAAASKTDCVARTKDSSSVSVHRSSLEPFSNVEFATGRWPTAEDVWSAMLCSVQRYIILM